MKNRLQSIDMLRGLAMLAVLAIHTPHNAPGGFRENVWFFPSVLMDYGYLGVHLFVLLSGYCIHRRAALSKAQTGNWDLKWLQFWKRRFWRLYPPYAVAMVLSLVAATWFHPKFQIDSETIGLDIVFHLLMIHNLTADFATSLGNGAFWSLGMEEQLYAGYFLILVLVKRSKWRTALAVAGTATIVWRCVSPHVGWIDCGRFQLGKWYLWPFMFWLHWALGAVAVDASSGNITLPRWTRSLTAGFLLMIVAVVINKIFLQVLQNAGYAIFISEIDSPGMKSVYRLGELFAAGSFFCFMNWIVKAENTIITSNPVSGLIASLGRISYSVYLVHVPVIYTIEPYDNFQSTGIQWLLRIALYWSLSILCGIAFYSTVERWFLGGQMPRFKPFRWAQAP